MQDYIDKSFTYAVLYQSINHKHMQDYTTNHAHAILSQSIIYICAEPYPDPLSHPNDISLLDLVHQQKRSDECANAKSTNTRRQMRVDICVTKLRASTKTRPSSIFKIAL